MRLQPATKEDQCSPHNHIMFIKTHKCGSTTLQNIFLRYGYMKNLTFSLPAKGNMLGYPHGFKVNMIPKDLLPPNGKTDIFTLHTRVTFKEQMKVLHNDTRWITVLREPASQFESFYNYFGLKSYYKLDLHEFKNMSVADISIPRVAGVFGKNQMTYVMGYPDNISGNDLRDAIKHLDDLFDLVIIYEYWDESLILLRHRLCWSLHDVVAFKKNARGKRPKVAVDMDLRRILRELNAADVELYEYFLAKHRRAVAEFGVERMAEEVLLLENLREEYVLHCKAIKQVADETHQGDESGSRFLKFRQNLKEICNILSLTEIPLINVVRKKQLLMLRKNA
ncbi:galactose-3-O-sulfotransferase 4-like isoform X2 [Penaeus japonicus]|nr:galactose-3-O-sulfotransferase 4-like isoform X2 [Penaeus japonicus]XP_042869541.1 galactose-3-O-sulfotransferase 4-like isoform X2 [Penaeus japonicus]XP_042869542.1 galactose-3-O-sulfotransferase 4-like isoform X2 [Penaeus japonicus]